MIDKYDDLARQSGAKLVHLCGHDCIPWDLTVMACANKLKEQNPTETMQSIHFFDEVVTTPSGGTYATAFNSLSNRTVYRSTLKFDPLLKSIEGNKHEGIFKVKNIQYLTFSKEIQAWMGPFVMASVNANCVRRSNALLSYGSSLTYSEGIRYNSFFSGFVHFFNMILLGTMIISPILRYIVKHYLIPSPGQFRLT